MINKIEKTNPQKNRGMYLPLRLFLQEENTAHNNYDGNNLIKTIKGSENPINGEVSKCDML